MNRYKGVAILAKCPRHGAWLEWMPKMALWRCGIPYDGHEMCDFYTDSEVDHTYRIPCSNFDLLDSTTHDCGMVVCTEQQLQDWDRTGKHNLLCAKCASKRKEQPS